jgi:hypothetical protein
LIILMSKFKAKKSATLNSQMATEILMTIQKKSRL